MGTIGEIYVASSSLEFNFLFLTHEYQFRETERDETDKPLNKAVSQAPSAVKYAAKTGRESSHRILCRISHSGRLTRGALLMTATHSIHAPITRL